jgi:hypothetical protein
MKTRKRTTTVTKLAYAWQRVDDAWQQFLVRWWSDQTVSVDPLIRVHANASVCLNCLSHDVTYIVPHANTIEEVCPELSCQACGITYKVLN